MTLAGAAVAISIVAAAAPAAQSQIPEPIPAPGAPCATAEHVCAGYGEADSTWHVGAGAGQYADKSPDSAQGLADQSEIDPHNHSTTQKNSYGVQSRLSFRAIVVEDAEGDHVAFVKSDNYLAMDALLRRAGQILATAGSRVSYDEIMHMASHNHFSPMYTTPSWGVWAFQDVMDIRAFEYQARQMAKAILEAEEDLAPARMGATQVNHYLFKGMVARRTTGDDNTPVGYPLDFGDFGLPVIRFDNLNTGEPIAALINWGMHPEGLEGDDLITAEFLAPLERFVEEWTGAPLVFGQGDVGSSESGPARPYHPDWPEGVFRQWDNAGHAQVERGAFLLARDVARGWGEAGSDEALVPFTASFDVAAGNAWVPGPLSQPYPSYSNCRTEPTAEGNPGAFGLPDCTRAQDSDDRRQMIYETLKQHGIPVPDHYKPTAFTGVEENMRLHLQAFKMGEVILMSCACEAQVDLILNLESRTNETQGDEWLGYKWWERLDCVQNEDTSWTCTRKPNDTPDGATHDVSPGSTFMSPLTFSDAAMKRMKAEVTNDAAGWNDPENVVAANSEPQDPELIWGNFTHDELTAEEGYKLPIGVGHAGDYNGYTVSYREYMAYDHYRKALTSYGPHTADYMNTVLQELARELNDPSGDHTYNMNEHEMARAAVDEARQVAWTTALGQASSQLYDAWSAGLPDDLGPAEALADGQPDDIKRFDSTTFVWRGGSNAVDNPVVKVQRQAEDGSWTDFADQSGEVQTKLQFPEGINGFAQTYAGMQSWTWTANFEAFDAFPKEIGSTPEGTYRFVVDGLIRQDGADQPYHLESEPFEVSRWDGVQVQDLRLEEDGSVSFTADSTYPDFDEGAAFRYVQRHTRSERGTGDEIKPGDQKSWCDTCSFRPWATKGEVQTALVTVTRSDGTEEKVAAQRSETGRWVAATDLFEGDAAHVAEGDVIDEYGERNGTGSGSVAGTRPKPDPTPTESPTPTPTNVARPTTLTFTEDSAEAGQYTDDATFEVALADDSGEPVEGASVDIALGGGAPQTVVTDANGIASASFDLDLDPGSYPVTAAYAGEPNRYLVSGAVASFVVTKENTALALREAGPKNDKRLVATLTDADDASFGIAERVIQFFVEGESLGTATTNGQGEATLTLPPRYRNGKHAFSATFDGSADGYFNSSETES